MFWIIPLSKKKAWKIASPFLEGPPHVDYLHSPAFTVFPLDGHLHWSVKAQTGREVAANSDNGVGLHSAET